MSDHSTYLSDKMVLKSTANPMKSYLWRVDLPMLQVRPTTDAKTAPERTRLNRIKHRLNGFAPADLVSVRSRVHSVTEPFPSFDTDKIPSGNSYWYAAKHNDIGNLSLQVYEYEDGKTLEYFNLWKSLIENPNGTYNPPVDYKQSVNVYHLSTTKHEIMKHTYEGYFVTEIADINNDYDGSGIITYQIQLTGDNVKSTKINIHDSDITERENEILETELEKIRKVGSLDRNRISRIIDNVLGGAF